MWKRKLLKNKIYAVVLILLGVVPILTDGDGTFFIFTLMLGIPLFLAKANWIIEKGSEHRDNKENRRKSVRSNSDSSRKKGYEHRDSEAACRVRA